MDWDDSIDPTVEAASRAEANDHSIDCNVKAFRALDEAAMAWREAAKAAEAFDGTAEAMVKTAEAWDEVARLWFNAIRSWLNVISSARSAAGYLDRISGAKAAKAAEAKASYFEAEVKRNTGKD